MNRTYQGRFQVHDYKKAFKQAVDELLGTNLSTPARVLAVSNLCESYVEQVGEVPDSFQLSRLAAYILMDDLKNSHPDKVSREEYPILNRRQRARRHRREQVAGEHIEQAARGVDFEHLLRVCKGDRAAS